MFLIGLLNNFLVSYQFRKENYYIRKNNHIYGYIHAT